MYCNVLACSLYFQHTFSIRKIWVSTCQSTISCGHPHKLPVNKCGNLIGKMTASFNASFAPSRPATSSHFTLGFSTTIASEIPLWTWHAVLATKELYNVYICQNAVHCVISIYVINLHETYLKVCLAFSFFRDLHLNRCCRRHLYNSTNSYDGKCSNIARWLNKNFSMMAANINAHLCTYFFSPVSPAFTGFLSFPLFFLLT